MGKAFQFPDLAFATSRLNWSCPLKTVPNGNRDSKANATEQVKSSGIKSFQPRIVRTTQRGIPFQSTPSVTADVRALQNSATPAGGNLPQRVASPGQAYILSCKCRFVFQKRAAETLCANHRRMARMPTVPRACDYDRDPIGTSVISLLAS